MTKHHWPVDEIQHYHTLPGRTEQFLARMDRMEKSLGSGKDPRVKAHHATIQAIISFINDLGSLEMSDFCDECSEFEPTQVTHNSDNNRVLFLCDACFRLWKGGRNETQ